MPLQSKPIPDWSADESPSFRAGSHRDWAYSPPSDFERHSALPEREAGVSHLSDSRHTFGRYSGHSGPTSGYTHGPRFSPTDRHNIRDTAPLQSQRSPSVTASDETHDVHVSEIVRLSAENDKLRQDLERERGRFESLWCVPIYFILSANYLQSRQGSIRTDHQRYPRQG